jgi:hypothetical protein
LFKHFELCDSVVYKQNQPNTQFNKTSKQKCSSASSAYLKDCLFALVTNIFLKGEYKKEQLNQAPGVHACNLSYSGGRDQEDRDSKPAQANSSRDPVLKNPITKILDWWSGSR